MHEYMNKSALAFKPSKYNHFVLDECDENSILGCNFLYRSIIRLPIEAHAQNPGLLHYLTGKSTLFEVNELQEDLLTPLTNAGFIVDDEVDELGVIKLRYNNQLYNNDTLRLTILPTLSCNLACPYCFEEKKAGKMGEKEEEALLNWLQENFRRKRNIYVAWFGGEPLLCKKTISRLSKKIQDFALSIGASYTASMTTNGYYFDREFQQQIRMLAMRSVQITLDGDREDHDKLRIRRTGEGSFDTIYQNIVDFCEHDNSECELVIRVNCTDENYAGVERLIKSFPESVKQRAKIFFRWVWPNEASGYKEFSQGLQQGEPFKPLFQMYETSHTGGWRTSNPDNDQTACYCEVDYLDQFHIDPSGNLFLCSHTFNESEAVGTVFGGSNYLNQEASAHYVKWYSAGPFEDNECVSCKLLPVCGGGCRKSRIAGERQCIEEKHSLDLYARDYINQLGMQQQKGVPS